VIGPWAITAPSGSAKRRRQVGHPGAPRPSRCCWDRRWRPGPRGAGRWTRCGTRSATWPRSGLRNW